MKTDDFDYHLPEELIAQTPLTDRSSSRLLVLDRQQRSYQDRHFTDLLDYLQPGDALVLNETKVLPARIYGTKADTGGAVELLLLNDLGNDHWECLARPQKRLHPGTQILFHDTTNATDDTTSTTNNRNTASNPNDPETSTIKPLLTATVTQTLPDGLTHVHFTYDGIFLEILDRLGTMPLPPYIHEQLQDQSHYQTVYAHELGSAAAPTAGLHFTPELLHQIEQKGVHIVKITLHVGLGTFRPVQVDDVQNHQMHTEKYHISETAATTLNSVRAAGHKIFAVGTTSVRTLETNLQRHPEFTAESGETSIFIYPGYQFKAIDALITNFHLPKSTLIMLISAFADRELILDTYRHAVAAKYRFFSFGDAMLII